MKTKLIFTGLALIATTAFISAQSQGNGNRKCNGTGKGTGFVDNNKNGICDNYENRTNKKTVGNNCNGQGKGKNFIDANKNGICDNYEAGTKK